MTRDIPSRVVEPDAWLSEHQALFEAGYTFFDFLTAVDRLDDPDSAGFDVVTHLYNVSSGATDSVLTKTRVPDSDEPDAYAELDSLTPIWRGAAWHERETYEMFGITFANFNDGTGKPLRKLLLPDAFTAHPLRKSFVLTPRASKPWPGAKEPGEREGGGPRRRKMTPPGVPDDTWGPR